MSIVQSQSQSLLPDAPGSVSVGIRTLRSLRQGQTPTVRLQKKIDTTYNYFLERVDPIIGDVITHLLCEQPIDVPGAMLNYLNKLDIQEKAKSNDAPISDADLTNQIKNENEPEVTDSKAKKAAKRPKKEQKLYLATSIGPIISKLVNRIANTRPKKIISFLCEELQTMIYGTDDEKTARAAMEIETDEIFEMYKGQNGPKVTLNKQATSPNVVAIPTESPELQRTTEDMEPPTDNKSAAHDLLGNDNIEVKTDSNIQVSESTPVPVPVPTEPELQKIQFAIIGMDGVGKSSIMNMIQGKADSQTKPTIGFRPVSMMAGENLQVRFYDIGGGPRIREIWSQYYHDVHGLVYVIDSTASEERAAEAYQIFKNSLSHEFTTKKPLLLVATKQDIEGATSMDDIKARYCIDEYANAELIACKPIGEAEEVDPRIEAALEALIKNVQESFDSICERVKVDSATKVKDDMKRRLARERKVLKNKISIAFMDLLSEENQPDLGGKTPNPEDQFTKEEGLNFLTSEIGEDLVALPNEALEICAMVGYQRLALQIVGGLHVPISKKKEPMSWQAIHDLIVEIRTELGLMGEGVTPGIMD
jgi:ADP-ribosylation factor-like protein 13B